MKRTAFSLLALFAFVLPARADKLDEWYKLLPKNTVGMMAIKNTPELLADWEKSSFSKFMADEAFLRWTAPSRKEGEAPWDRAFKEITGEGLYDSLKHYPGASLIVFAADSPSDFQGDDPPFAALSEAGDKEKEIQESKMREFELSKKKDDQLKESTIDVAGTAVHVLARGEASEGRWKDAYVFVNGVLVEGNSQKVLEHFITALSAGAAESSETASGHLERLAGLTEGNADFTFYINGVPLVKWVDDLAASKAKEGKTMIDPAMILGALGLNEFQAMALTINFTDDESRLELALLHPAKPTGLVSLLRATGPQETLPAFIPADVVAGSVSHFSLGATYDKLLAMIAKFGPMAMMATMQISELEKAAGVKLKEDLFGSLDDEYVEIADGDAAAQEVIMGFKIKDRQRFGGAMEGVKRFAGAGFAAFEESEFLGYQINTIKASQGGKTPMEIAYCISDDYLLISTGKQMLLKKILSRMKEPAGPSLWDAPRVQDQLGRLPKNYVGVGVSDAGKQMMMAVEAVTALQGQVGGKGKKTTAAATKKKGPGKGPKSEEPKSASKAGDSWFDPSAAPSEEVFKRYFGTSVNGVYNPADAIHLRILSTPVEAAP